MAGPSDKFVDAPDAIDSADYQAFLDDFSHQLTSREGEILHGHVLSVSDKEVIVDIGRKIEGLVPASQFPSAEGKPAVRTGDEIEVMIDRRGEPVEGYILLSYERPHRLHIWEHLEKAAADQTPVTGRVMNKVKGGLAVDIGAIAFLPSSQVEIRPIHNLDSYLGREIEVIVLKLNRRRGNAIVSRRELLEREMQRARPKRSAGLYEGAVVSGVIKNLTDYGAFVDLGGIDGLLHVSDLSYGNVAHPAAVVQVGDQVTVKVLKFDREKERISLGMKQLHPDPWNNIDARYPRQSRVVGRVVSVTDYGAFVELETGVEGLIHISEMTWSRRMKHPAKVVKAGDSVEAVVLEVKSKERRISLGIKQLEADPWTTVADRYSVGSVVEGPGAEAGGFRRFHRNRRRHRRAGAHLGPVLDGAREASFGAGEERADGAGRDSEHRRSEPAPVARSKAIAAGRLGDVLPYASGGRPRQRESVPGCAVRGICGITAGSRGLVSSQRDRTGIR